jgi:glycosyltransferase 2 family protein
LKVRLTGILKFVFFLGVGLLITWLSLRGLTPSDRSDLVTSFGQVKPFWLLVVLAASVMSHLLRALRWQMLLEPVAVKPSLRNTFAAVMIGYLANMAFPRLGEVTRCGVLLTTDKIPVNRSLGTVVTDRTLDFAVFILLAVVLFLTQYGYIITYLETQVAVGFQEKFSSLGANHLLLLMVCFAVVTGAAAVWVLLRAKPQQRLLYRGRKVLVGFLQGLISVRYVKRPLLFLLYTFSIWGAYFLMTWLSFRVLDDTAALGMGAGLAVLLLGTIGIVLTPGGIGLYPVIARDTLMLYGVSTATGFAMGWILWTTQTVIIILTGLVSLLWLSLLKRKIRLANNMA